MFYITYKKIVKNLVDSINIVYYNLYKWRIFMSERKLATIQEIEKIDPIQGKDVIGLATMKGLGWHVIVNKNDIKVGDKVVYFEVDSQLDSSNPAFEFMSKRKWRVKTMKLGGVFSQGLCIKADELGFSNYKIGEDVTEKLKVTKYDPEAQQERAFARVEKHSKLVTYLLKFSWFRKLYYFGKPGVRTFPTSWISKTDECFRGKTLVTTEKGKMRIRDIVNNKLGIKVLSYNHNTNTLEYKPVVGWFSKREEDSLMSVKILTRGHGNRTSSIVCTKNHKFFTKNGYIEASKLKPTDILLRDDNSLTEDGKSILLGCLLGDASIVTERRHPNSDTLNKVSFCQGIDQLDYLKFKVSLFGGDVNSLSENKCDTGYNSSLVFHHTVKSNLDIHKVINNYCLKGSKKYVSEKWANALTPMSLAFWYMDDGTLTVRGTGSIYIRLCTQGFTLEENNNLLKSLYYKFGIFGVIHLDKRCNKYFISLDDGNAKKFIDIVKPYMHESLLYKLPKQENYSLYRYSPVLEYRLSETPIVEVGVESAKNRYKNGSKVYDIQVEGNNNYFVHGVLVHNCRIQNNPDVLEKYKGYTLDVSEKIDGQSATYLLKPYKGLFTKWDFQVCSRNLQVDETGSSTYAFVNKKYSMREKCQKLLEVAKKDYPMLKYVGIQGEILAPEVQKNKYKKTEPCFYVFNIILGFDDKKFKCGNDMVVKYCSEIGLDTVPMLPKFVLEGQTVDDMVELSRFKSTMLNIDAEGKVYRVTDGMGFVEDSFKVINPDFLVKNGD